MELLVKVASGAGLTTSLQAEYICGGVSVVLFYMTEFKLALYNDEPRQPDPNVLWNPLKRKQWQ